MSNDYIVPTKAVLAAADAMGLLPDEIDNVLLDGLKAAAPYMLAEAWDEGKDVPRNYRGDAIIDNPYRVTK